MGQFVPASENLRCVGLGIMRGKLFGIVVVANFRFPPSTPIILLRKLKAIMAPLKNHNILPTDTGSLFNDFKAQPLMVKQHDATIG